MKVERWGYCGVCRYFKNMIYCENYEDFQKYPDTLIEECFCDFHVWPIKLTREEYENIPDWCPVDDDEV